tara:strand:+ start:82 stop:429 length:348 start_codon:yes stop_codon:yes gene_type:complete
MKSNNVLKHTKNNQAFIEAYYDENITIEEFQKKYMEKAFKEGWAIFESDYGLSLERDDESCIFKNDLEAWNFVVVNSLKGSKMHIEALSLLKNHSKEEYYSIMENTKKLQNIYSF